MSQMAVIVDVFLTDILYIRSNMLFFIVLSTVCSKAGEVNTSKSS